MPATPRKLSPLTHYAMLGLIYGTALFTLLGLTVWHPSKTHSGNDHNHANVHEPIHNCRASENTVQVTIQNGAISPQTIHVKHCENVKIVNSDSRLHTPALGEHNNHTPYPGFEEMPLKPGQSYTFVAEEHGTYLLHDHLNEDISTTLIIE